MLLDDAPPFHRKHVVPISYYDTDLICSTITSRSVTRRIQFLKRLLLIGTSRSRLLMKELLMDHSTLLLGHALSRLWILGILFAAFVFLSGLRVSCLEITTQ